MTLQALGIRIKAFIFDYLYILTYLFLITMISLLIQVLSPGTLASLFADPLQAQIIGFFLVTVPIALYFILQESSSHMGTRGKRRMGIQVTDLQGNRISVGRSVLRTTVKLIPWELSHFVVWRSQTLSEDILTLLIVVVWILVAMYFFLIGISATSRSFYDIFAGTKVVIIQNK